MHIKDVRNKMPLNPNPRRRYKRRRLNKIKKLVLHCTGTGEPELMALARYDVTPWEEHHISKQGCPGFTYHYFIDKDGTISYTSDLKNITWHAGNHNGDTVGVCIKYKSKDNDNPPPKEQLEAACSLLAHLCLKLRIDPDKVKGHRELQGTGYKIINGVRKLRKDCPGLLVNMSEVRYIISKQVQAALKQSGLYSGPIDGVFGPMSEAALKNYRP